jgi:hypothetical protein
VTSAKLSDGQGLALITRSVIATVFTQLDALARLGYIPPPWLDGV